MKSVRTKLIASILICSLFTSVLIGVIAISNSVRTAGKDAMTMMQLTGQKKTEEINSTIQKIEQSVDTLSEVAMSNFDYDSFRQSKDYADTYTETVQQAVLDFANHTNGAVTVYLRYNPNYSNPTSGVFAQRQSVDSELQCLTPTDFSMYDFYGYVSECRGIEIKKDENFTIDIDKVIETCNNENVKLLIFSNPCNPTSVGLTREAVRKIIRGVSALVVLDEAYMDFWNESMLGEFENYDNLLILKTCSKAFGLAALRVGFAVGNEKLVRAIKAVKSPYNVNTCSQKMAEAVLKNRAEADAAIRRLLLSRDELQQKFDRMAQRFPEKLQTVKSVTNFVVLRTPYAKELYERLLAESIAVRYFKNMSVLRITAGSTGENAVVTEHIQRFFEEKEQA